MVEIVEMDTSVLYCDNVVYVKSINESNSTAEIEFFDPNNKIITITVDLNELRPLILHDEPDMVPEDIDTSHLHVDLGISEERLEEILRMSDNVFSSSPTVVDALKTMCDQVNGYEMMYIGLMVGISFENARLTKEFDAYLEETGLDDRTIEFCDTEDPEEFD